ncbi:MULTISPECIES: quorum-sensing sensor histidine kinase AgrC [Staphylococcus]|uniref:GHKL domain-containing protein n=4 Tax=Staphylococcus capitis TaxID=29388 RepID=A0A7Z8E2A7_STACP|nr:MULTISPECIES: GHKL domain-containing protein [Staphylococcus]MBC8780943.1 GHKL domain-containing protein [Staphylococcus capitis]MBE7322740.1 GHKL domain-containing protein [Staphylococcus capitis]MCC3691533.1 GHKL domain-containing protein [Staphylococcus capitis]MCC9111432.1 GHKL domain-containing protein [Staphylococcus capitis]MCM3508688.1 GHKL domain-containing protein [Staphylococcus capitis]
MDALNYAPYAGVQTLLLFLIIKIILDIKFNYKDYLFTSGIIILSVYTFSILGSKTLPILVVVIFIFFYKKIKLYSFLAVLISNIVLYLTNFLSVTLYLNTREIINNNSISISLHFVIFVVIAILLAYILKFLFKKLKGSYLSLNKKYITIITIVLLFSFVFFYIISQTDLSANDSLTLYAFIFVGLIIFLSILIFVLSTFTLREMKYKRNLEEIETYYEYTLRIESINNEMRKFRHDYVNILSTLSEFIREDDMQGLKKYFNEQIVPMKDNMKTRSIKINGIENLKVREIKGLITTKILQAQEKAIPISIEVPDEIDKIEMNTIEFSRISGIILDNAIEASEVLDDPLIQIAFINNEESVTFIVMNKCSDDTPKIHELFEEGFSTKGDNRGLGLSTLKELTDQNENVLLDTVIENGYFVQKVEIINTEA